ncbi:MAG: ABC transporter permease, partial [Fidelibacterota bacterium]
MKNLTLGLGRRFLISRKRVGFVSWSAVMAMLGVAVGCFAVLTAIAVLNGFTSELEGRVSGFESDLRIVDESINEELQKLIMTTVATLPEVENSARYLEKRGIIIRDDTKLVVSLKAVEMDKLSSVYHLIIETELERPSEKPGIVIGAELAS